MCLWEVRDQFEIDSSGILFDKPCLLFVSPGLFLRRSLLCHQERLYGGAQNGFQDIPEFQAGCTQVTQSAKSKANPKKLWADINEMWSHPTPVDN